MPNILLSGVPGGGKTWMGNELERRFGFEHLDMEQDDFLLARKCQKGTATFLNDLAWHRVPGIVMTWGFHPFSGLSTIKEIVAFGFIPIWFDGNRAHFFSTFMSRECGDAAKELDYYGQMAAIIQTRIKDLIPWIPFYPYRSDGNFWEDSVDRLLKNINF